MKYKGETCIKCGTAFTEDDDIVVCPECGSPHHRHCFKENGSCANSHKHSEGFLWRPRYIPPKKPEPEAEAYCPFCNFKVDLDAEECPRCKRSLVESGKRNENGIVPNSFPILFGFEHDKKINGAKAWELVYFVSKNPMYYLPLFNHFAETGKKISFNLFCFIFPPVYFAYRRMNGWAVFTAILSVILALPLTVSYFVDMGTQDISMSVFSQPVLKLICDNSRMLDSAVDTCNVLDLLMRVVLCLFGNRIYFSHATNSVRALRRIKRSSKLTVTELRQAGGVRLINVFCILGFTFLLSVLALTASQVFLESLL